MERLQFLTETDWREFTVICTSWFPVRNRTEMFRRNEMWTFFSWLVLLKTAQKFNYISICPCVCVSSSVSWVKDIFKVTHQEQATKSHPRVQQSPSTVHWKTSEVFWPLRSYTERSILVWAVSVLYFVVTKHNWWHWKFTVWNFAIVLSP